MLTLKKSIKQVFSARMIMVYVLGVISGLPLAYTGTTLQAWLTSNHINLYAIGFITLVGTPYSYKFIWAPLLDRYKPFVPLINHKRKAWIFYFQILLAAALFFMSGLNPVEHLYFVAIAGLLIAFVSASQDIVIDAYRTEYLASDERGIAAASFTFAYRVGMLLSGGLGLIVADHYGWQCFFILSSLMMLLGAFVCVFLPKTQEANDHPGNFFDLLINPFINFLTRKHALTILFFIASYKFAEGYILSLATAFFLNGVNLTLTQVGVLFKTVGFISTILGAYIAGILLPRLGLYRSLMIFGVLQALGTLLYVALAMIGHGYIFTAITVAFEMGASGMSTVALMAYFMSLCDKKFTGTQFAIFTAVMVIGRIISGPLASIIVESYGWAWMFFLGFIISFPGLFLLRRLRASIVG